MSIAVTIVIYRMEGQMAYKVFWHVPHQVLFVELDGQLSLDDFNQINNTVLSHLDDATGDTGFTLLVNTAQVSSVPQAFQQLKASQTYVQRRDLQYIVVVGNNKLIRLMMLLTFNLCRPALHFFEDIERAYEFLRVAAAPVRSTTQSLMK
jgi:hypothetical protein